jgi:hypothetical protein
MKRRLSLSCCFLIGPLVTSAAVAQDKKPENKQNSAVTDAAKGGEDFAIQGEYSGELERRGKKRKFGLQIIALGDGAFNAVGYFDGLPGDGWDQTNKVSVNGKLKDGVVDFNDKGGIIRYKDRQVDFLDDDKSIGTLKKVERKSPTLGAKPPGNAVVLFDGTTAEHFEGGRMTEDKLLMQGVTSKQKFQSFSLHLEFMLPFMPYARGQGRANSGCYLQGRYEVQILDSFGLEGKNNECGGIYETRDPDVNMCFPPLAWQTYDIDYTAAVYDEAGKKTKNARMTVRHNGVVVHKDVELPKSTRGNPVPEGPTPGPIYLQDHGNPVRFRNIWLVEKK